MNLYLHLLQKYKIMFFITKVKPKIKITNMCILSLPRKFKLTITLLKNFRFQVVTINKKKLLDKSLRYNHL